MDDVFYLYDLFGDLRSVWEYFFDDFDIMGVESDD